MPDRRTFAPVVGLGLPAAVLASVAGAKTWVSAAGGSPPGSAAPITAVTGTGEEPLALALGLVVLACWGVVLVTRRTRRFVACLGLLASLGYVVVVVHGGLVLPDQLETRIASSGLDGPSEVGLDAWFWVAAVSSLLCVLTALAAVRFAPSWPAMGSRYDAPGSRQQPRPTREPEEIDLWKSLDGGEDPTQDPDR